MPKCVMRTKRADYVEIEKFRNFGGLRNEEDYLITAQGSRLLGKALPLTVEGVEAERE